MIKSLAETVHRFAIKIPKKWYKKPKYIVPAVVAFALISTGLILLARAADTGVQLEAENTTLSGQVSTVSDTTASGGKALKFGNGSSGSSGTGTTTNPGGGSLLNPASSYTTYSNLTYGPQGSNQLDLYIPKSTGPHPLVVYVHGGGWLEGDKSECFPKEFGMIERGFAAACINYRLTSGGSVPFPAQIIDVKSAIRYLRANAAKYEIYTTKVGVMGASAGGHLAEMAGTSGGFADFDKGQNLDQSSTVQAVCSFYGPSDLLTLVQEYPDHDKSGQPEPMLLGKSSVSGYPTEAKYASPTTYVDAADPPFLLYHGTSDDTVPQQQSELMNQKLKAVGVSSTLHLVSGFGHADSRFEDGRYDDEVSSFFDQYLR